MEENKTETICGCGKKMVVTERGYECQEGHFWNMEKQKYTKKEELESSSKLEAWVRLVRLCGCNNRVPAEIRGKSAFVQDPHNERKQYRINAEAFLAGKGQYRDGWAISIWNEKAEHRSEVEKDWQD